MNLSTNFSLKEFTFSQTAIRLGINNEPDAAQLQSLKNLCINVLQRVRDHYNKSLKISSGLRVPKLNKAIGGSSTSDHTKGMAADIEIEGLSNLELARWIRDNLKFTQLILEGFDGKDPNSGWVHVSYDPSNLKCQCLTAKFVKGKAVYINGF